MSNSELYFIKTVLFKGFECKVMYDYQNGNYEILFGDKIILVDKTEIKFKEEKR